MVLFNFDSVIMTLKRVEVKVDGPGSKWTVRKDIKWTVQNTKVDGPQRMKRDGTQSAWVVKNG